MNEDIYAEWLVKRKTPFYRIPVIILMVAAVIGSFILMIKFMWGFIVFLLVFFAVGITFRYLKVEYEYIFVTTELSIDKIYSGKSRKNAMKIEMEQVQYVEPTNEERNKNMLAGNQYVRVDYSSHTGKETYTINCDNKGKKYLVIFEPNDKVLRAMWRCSPSKVQIKK